MCEKGHQTVTANHPYHDLTLFIWIKNMLSKEIFMFNKGANWTSRGKVHSKVREPLQKSSPTLVPIKFNSINAGALRKPPITELYNWAGSWWRTMALRGTSLDGKW